MKDRNKIEDIIVRKILGIATLKELEFIKNWCNESKKNREFYEKITSNNYINNQILMRKSIKININKEFAKNIKQINNYTNKNYSIVKRILSYVAVLIIIFGATHLIKNKIGIEKNNQVQYSSSLIPAGSSKAVLVLFNGESIELNTKFQEPGNENGLYIKVDSNIINNKSILTSISFVNNDSIINSLNVSTINNDFNKYNKIITPRGGEYLVTLSDGTIVHLNAMSELEFPMNFSDGDRIVKLKGEAYFDVKHKQNNQKFIVKTKDSEIEVLGTKFNVEAYESSNIARITLCSGKVKVTEGKRSVILLPGEQLMTDIKNKTYNVEKVYTDFYISWVNGNFMFNNARMEDVFEIFKRWYDIEVLYLGLDVRNLVFTGSLPRFEDLNKLLKLIEKVSNVRFKINGKTIIVSEKNI